MLHRSPYLDESIDDAINVEFIIEEFYWLLVYVATDNPQDVHDTCTNGGKAVQQLAPLVWQKAESVRCTECFCLGSSIIESGLP